VISIQALQILLLFFTVANGIAFFIFLNDKKKAENNTWRTPERTLLLWGLAAPFGAFLAMRIFRHKTQKAKFLLVPVSLIAQLVLISYGVVYYFW
jgi:uncharacterized membrane protein YsdA (DUF1294 family)